ncbi:MAG: SdiA-regulated domain-containing protein [Desulfobacteraceae bacterium]|jgi:uncharacterized protein YjiK
MAIQFLLKVVGFIIGFNFLISICYGEMIFDYNLDIPDVQYELPTILAEVSGLTDIDSSHVACVQDELGIVFIYNFISGKIVSQHAFENVGDFEGLAYTGDAIFILRSDGRLTEWNNFKSNSVNNIKHFKLPLLTTDNEGLCYDKKHNQLLIAAKNKPIDRNEKFERYIYSFDILQKRLSEKPLSSINTKQLSIKSKEFNIPPLLKKNGKKKKFNFRSSSLAIHPLSDDIYIISASDKLLLVINRKNEIRHIERLNSELFRQAEGITFLHDGTMIIANEAKGKIPTLLLYKMKNKKTAK